MLNSNRKAVLLGALWFLVTLLFILLMLMLDISRYREKLQLESGVIYEYTYERALINEILLNNFVSLADSDGDAYSHLARYARQMREHYPHISYFLLYQRVPADQVERFERDMRAKTGSPFRIRRQAGGEDGESPSNQSFFYPAVFVEPVTAETRHLLGLDGYSIPQNRIAMMKAGYYMDVFASKAYPMISGEMGYRLFHVIDLPGAGYEGGQLIASLGVKANTLLPPRPHVNSRLDIELLDGRGQPLAVRHASQTAGWLSHRMLPLLEETKVIHRFGQSFTLVIRKQIFWSEMSWLTAFVVLLLSSAAFFFAYQNYTRRKDAQAALENVNQRLLAERDQLEQRVQERTWELVQANTDLRDQVKENRNLTQKVINIQEEERRNLARELHDEMGQSLTAIRMDAHLLKNSNQAQQQSLEFQAASSIDHIAERLYGVTYGLMRALRPAALDDLGLADALQECIANAHLANAGIEVEHRFEGDFNDLPERLNISCYRLLQEALNNCLKHSGAQVVSIRVERLDAPDRLMMVIEDDGCGFDSKVHTDGFGIIGMRERVYGLGGHFNLTTGPGKGTRIEACLIIDAHQLQPVRARG